MYGIERFGGRPCFGLESLWCAILLLLVLGTGPVLADVGVGLGLDPTFHPNAETDPFQQSLPTGSGSLLSRTSVGVLLGFGTAALVTKRYENIDHTARILDGSPLDGVIDFGDRYGDGWTLGAGTLGLCLLGRLAEDDKLRAAGTDMARTLLLSWGTVWALKVMVNAERPNGGAYSFPSGHTATAFCSAPIIHKYWGWKAGAAAYAVATTTGLARMEDHKHYLADVLFGAAIGLVMGLEVAREDGEGGLLDHIAAAPQGLGLSIRF